MLLPEALDSPFWRRVLWIALAVNVCMFLGEVQVSSRGCSYRAELGARDGNYQTVRARRQRVTATRPQIASTIPNGHAPWRNP